MSERSKRRRTEELWKNIDTEELTFIARAKLWSSGQVNASLVLAEVTKCQTYAEKCRRVSTDKQANNIFKAVYILAHKNLSRQDYETVRAMNKKLFPSYSILQRAKKDCYPRKPYSCPIIAILGRSIKYFRRKCNKQIRIN